MTTTISPSQPDGLMEIPTEAKQTCGETDEQVQLFEQDGFLCIPNALPITALEEIATFASNYFENCFQNLHKAGHTPFPSHVRQSSQGDRQYALGLGIKHGFREIVMRSPGRYELSLLNCPQAPSIEYIKKSLYPLVPNILGASQWEDVSLCHLSLVIATPGCPEQSWHADGGHVSLTEHKSCHVANVFLPLHDVPLELGPTEFRPGSQVYTRNLAPMLLAAKARKQLRAPLAPELNVGDALIFDYRVLHRGKANQSDTINRPILVLTFSKPWYKDVCNFPKRSMYDPTEQEEAG